jgi:hypothetical protein
LIIAGVVVAVIVDIGSVIFLNQRQSSLLAHVSAQQDSITLADNRNLKSISHQSNSEVSCRVTLKDTPKRYTNR